MRLSQLPIIGKGNYEPNFHVEVRGLDRIVEKAVSGSEGEYRLGRAAIGQSPVQEVSVIIKTKRNDVYGYSLDASKQLVKRITGFVPSYTLEAVIEGDGSKSNLPVDTDLVKKAGFSVAEVGKDTFLHIRSGTKFPRSTPVQYSGRSQSATLTYSLDATDLTAAEVGKTITGFAQALESVVNGIYKAARKSPPDKTLSLRLGEKVSRIKGQKAQPVATGSDSAGISSPYSEKDGEEEFTKALQPTKSSLTFNDVGGYQSVKEQLGDFLLAIKNPTEAKRHGYTPSKGVLIHGPPGTGKTLFGKALAGESGAEFIYYNASDMLQKYVGDSPKALKAAFEEAQQRADKTKKPVILFIDELDSVFPQRGTAHDVKIELVNLFNQYMDGFESKKITNVWIVGATNRLREMDESATRAGRFVKIEVPLPDLEARTAIFQVTQETLEKEAETRLFDAAIDYAALAKSTEKFSGADIAAVMRNTRQKAFRQATAAGQKSVVMTTDSDLEAEIHQYIRQKGDGSGKGPIGFKRQGG